MTENIILTDISPDPFKDQTPLLTNIHFTNENMILVDGLYHKTQDITFDKNEDTNLSDIVTGEIRTYINSKIIAPVASQKVTAETPSGTPTYEMKTVRNRDLGSEKPISEIEGYTFYTADQDSLNQRHYVFDSNTPMVGSPKPQLTGNGSPQYYNSIYMTYSPMGTAPGERMVAEYLNDVDDDFSLNVYERFQILVGHYSNAIKTLNNTEELTLKMVFDSFGYPFPEDAYYTISNKDTDLSYNSFIQDDILGGILESLSKRTMDYKLILTEKETSNEILFFRIEKWFSETPVGTPNQVFFIPATDENKLFIDMQIKQDKTYHYRVTAYNAVIGQEYFFNNIVDNVTFGSCTVEVRPKISLYETIIFEGSLINIPAPPLPPSVSFHNKISSEGKVKIYLELQRNSDIAPFIPVSDADSNKVGSNYILPNGDIEFKYRKESARFQVFRKSEQPKTYNDFFDNLIGTFENNNMTENMAILDNIRPNKKYYYTFRTINIFGSLSNPTPVFEVELIKDADDSRILVNSFLFNNTPPLFKEEGNLNFRSLLHMNVATQQLEFNVEDLRNTDGFIPSFQDEITNINLGSTELALELVNKIWGRKFKFRVRSNDSGKIIDFNVKVNLIKEEDFSV